MAKYYSALDEQQMLAFSNTLTSLAHSIQKHHRTYKTTKQRSLLQHKNTKENTRHLLYDGLGPAFHYLLDSDWFEKQSKNLNDLKSIKTVNEPYTVALYYK